MYGRLRCQIGAYTQIRGPKPGSKRALHPGQRQLHFPTLRKAAPSRRAGPLKSPHPYHPHPTSPFQVSGSRPASGSPLRSEFFETPASSFPFTSCRIAPDYGTLRNSGGGRGGNHHPEESPGKPVPVAFATGMSTMLEFDAL